MTIIILLKFGKILPPCWSGTRSLYPAWPWSVLRDVESDRITSLSTLWFQVFFYCYLFLFCSLGCTADHHPHFVVTFARTPCVAQIPYSQMWVCMGRSTTWRVWAIHSACRSILYFTVHKSVDERKRTPSCGPWPQLSNAKKPTYSLAKSSWALLNRPPTNVRVKSRSWIGYLWHLLTITPPRVMTDVCEYPKNPTWELLTRSHYLRPGESTTFLIGHFPGGG